jgi:hypothetical protein
MSVMNRRRFFGLAGAAAALAALPEGLVGMGGSLPAGTPIAPLIDQSLWEYPASLKRQCELLAAYYQGIDRSARP